MVKPEEIEVSEELYEVYLEGYNSTLGYWKDSRVGGLCAVLAHIVNNPPKLTDEQERDRQVFARLLRRAFLKPEPEYPEELSALFDGKSWPAEEFIESRRLALAAYNLGKKAK